MGQLLLPCPVTLTVPCRTSWEPGARVRRHRVTLHPDGRVETPHDLASERVAMALGGYLSCLDLVDRAAPALRAWLLLVLREDPCPIRSDGEGRRWWPGSRAECCAGAGYGEPERAAAHAREPSHLAAVHGANPHQVRTLVRGVGVGVPAPPRDPLLARLWECGIAPERALAAQQRVRAAGRLPVEFHLGMMQRKADLGWLADTLAAVDGDVRVAVWLAWTVGEADRRDPGLRGRWLRAGVPPRVVLSLVEAGYGVGEVTALAGCWGVSVARAGLVLADWVGHGYRPTVAMLSAPGVGDRGSPAGPPAAGAVARLRAALPGRAEGVGDTDLAVALVRHGTVWHAARAWRQSPPSGVGEVRAGAGRGAVAPAGTGGGSGDGA